MSRGILVLALGLWSSASLAVGFSSGSEFTHTELRGRVSLWCTGSGSDPSQHRTVYCDGYIFDPGTHDYLVTEESIDATHVELSVEKSEGKVRKKKVRFDSKKNRSTRRFNLWVSSLTQRPLLHLGSNDVNYKFTKNKAIVDEGQFRVQVNDGGVLQCRPRSMTSHNTSDCRGGGYSICDRYFYLENYCQN